MHSLGLRSVKENAKKTLRMGLAVREWVGGPWGKGRSHRYFLGGAVSHAKLAGVFTLRKKAKPPLGMR